MNQRDLVGAARMRFSDWGRDLPGDWLFALDNSIDYSDESRGTVRIRRHDLFSLEEDDRWSSTIAPGASWVHFTYLGRVAGKPLLSIRRGPTTNIAVPAINISGDGSAEIEVID